MTEAKQSLYAKPLKEWGGWGLEIAALWLPGAGIAGRLLEKAPLEEVEIWLRNRARSGDIVVPDITEITQDVAADAGGASFVAPALHQAPAPTVLDVGDLLRQYAAVRESGPFEAALRDAIQESIRRLETFMQETTRFEGLADSGNGVWPAFALEWKLRRSLGDRLGKAAIVTDHPTLRRLIETDLAAGLIDAFMAADISADQPQTIKRLVQVFAATSAFLWPLAKGFRSGYLMANVMSPFSLKTWDGKSDVVRTLDLKSDGVKTFEIKSDFGKELVKRWAGTPEFDAAQAKKDKEMLDARLGGLSNCGRDELTRAWLRSCLASELSEQQREVEGRAPNPFLSRVEHPLVHIDQEDLLAEIREDIEAIVGGRGTVSPDRGGVLAQLDGLYAQLDVAARAFAISDAEGFDKATKSINMGLRVRSNAQNEERIGRVLQRLKLARGWT